MQIREFEPLAYMNAQAYLKPSLESPVADFVPKNFWEKHPKLTIGLCLTAFAVVTFGGAAYIIGLPK